MLLLAYSRSVPKRLRRVVQELHQPERLFFIQRWIGNRLFAALHLRRKFLAGNQPPYQHRLRQLLGLDVARQSQSPRRELAEASEGNLHRDLCRACTRVKVPERLDEFKR